MNIIPTEQQKEALIKTKKWWYNKEGLVWEISGAAGTGKTTIVYMLIEELGLSHDDVLFMAYVGKATLALARKGNRAQTIHSTIYNLIEEVKRDENGNPIIIQNREVMTKRFIKKDRLPDNIKLIVLDEGAMVSQKIAEDILSFGIPMIVLGDTNQLPPIYGESYFLRNPDVVLTEPMRQAADSPIIQLATKAIRGDYIKYGKYGENGFVIPTESLTNEMLMKPDIVICGRNITRSKINRHIRENVLHKKHDQLTIGDKIICRQNNWSISPIDNNIFLINGLIGYVEDMSLESYDHRSIEIDFRPEFLNNICFERIKIDYKHLMKPTDNNSIYNGLNKFEYAYAITCHLAQGSEYNNVLIINEQLGTHEYHRRWLYTAITRAKKNVIIAM